MDRRGFLKGSTAVALGLAGTGLNMRAAWGYALSPTIPKFRTPLRRFGTDIPLSAPDGGSGFGNAVHYTVDMNEYVDQIAAGLPPTRLWGYAANGVNVHLGGGIAATRGQPVQVTFRNNLPPQHILPVDRSIPGAGSGPDNRTAIHLHGGKTPWISDGTPNSWFTNTGLMGSERGAIAQVFSSPVGQAEYFYPNNQSARLMWYHDHAMGYTRLNAYAGLAAPYVLTDATEAQIPNLPSALNPRTHYLVFQDKVFNADGSLWYPSVYEPARWALGPATTTPLPVPSVVPEMFGDTILVNGTTYPFVHLDQGVHRLRMLNACNARFLNPRLYLASAGAPTEADIKAPGPGFTQIGTEGGLLPYPVQVNGPRGLPLLLAPAERADLLLDLRNVAAGTTLILYNDAPAPFPGGAALNDFYPGNPKTPGSTVGNGPNTRTLLQIVVTGNTTPNPMPALPANLMAYSDPLLVTPAVGVPTTPPAGTPVRQLTLNESFDTYGRLIQMLGTTTPSMPAAGFGLAFDAPPTEIVRAGSTEVWEIFNLTADTHPIHFHLVNVQVLSRQKFSKSAIARGNKVPFNPRTLNYAGQPAAPDANELGWKETVRMNSGEVTRVLVKFDLPGGLPFTTPLQTYTSVGGQGQGHPYVWHCHILEHEEHDMMRPFIVTP